MTREVYKKLELKWNLESLPLLVFSGLVLEVIYSLPEESDAEESALVVFKQQPGGGGVRTRHHTCWVHTVC